MRDVVQVVFDQAVRVTVEGDEPLVRTRWRLGEPVLPRHADGSDHFLIEG